MQKYVLLLMILMHAATDACTRLVYQGQGEVVISAMNVDWPSDVPDLKFWKFPRGLSRSGLTGERPVNWVSSYGSVVLTGYNMGVGEGVNEAGLAVHALALAEVDYGETDDRPTISIGVWVQYVLDNYATTDEAVKGLTARELEVVPVVLPDGNNPIVYLAMTDSSGDTAVIEYLDGKQVIHQDRDYRIMANISSRQTQRLLEQQSNIPGPSGLPGGCSSIERLLRADYYLKQLPELFDAKKSVAAIRHIQETLSVPASSGKADPSTVYRTLFDHKNKHYYFQGIDRPLWFRISLEHFDFDNGEVLSLDVYKQAPVVELSNFFKPTAFFL